MTGVEILATEEVAVAFDFCWFGFWIMFGSCSIIGTIWGIWTVVSGDCDWVMIPVAAVVSTALGALFGVLLGVGLKGEPIAYEIQYKVTVSDEVPMNEFFERYEIIDQEGKVYTIRERDDIPTIEKETIELQHGYWTGRENAECSMCGNFCVMAYTDMRVKYCPNCGAKMDGE